MLGRVNQKVADCVDSGGVPGQDHCRRVHLDDNCRSGNYGTDTELAAIVNHGIVPLLIMVKLRVVKLGVFGFRLFVANLLEIGGQTTFRFDDRANDDNFVILAVRERK